MAKHASSAPPAPAHNPATAGIRAIRDLHLRLAAERELRENTPTESDPS